MKEVQTLLLAGLSEGLLQKLAELGCVTFSQHKHAVALLQLICAIQRQHASSNGALELHADGTLDALRHHAAVDAGRHRVGIIGDKARPKVHVSLSHHGLSGISPAFRRYHPHEACSWSVLIDQLLKELLHKSGISV